MRNSLKKLFNEGWTGKELSDFLRKHGVERKWGTILNDIKNGERFFAIKKISGYVILPDDTVKRYIEFIIRTKKIKKVDGSAADPNELIRDISVETRERLSEKNREEESNKIFGEETIGQYDRCGCLDDRIITMGGSIKTVRRF